MKTFALLLLALFAPAAGALAQLPVVSGCVWWFDDRTDDIDTVYFDTPAREDVELDFDAANLSPGLHTLHLRFFDRRGVAVRWTGVISEPFVRRSADAPQPNVMSQFRYWFDARPEDVTQFPILPQATLSTVQIPLITDGLPVDTLQVFHQFGDGRGQWSSVIADTFFNSVRPIADFELLNDPPCAGQPLSFRSQTTFVRDFFWTFGDGGTSAEANPTHTYASPGEYTVTMRASNPLFEDSVITVSKTYTALQGERSVYAPFGDTAICTGRGLTFFAEARGDGYAYEWLRDGSAVPQATGPLFRATEGGRYQLVLRNDAGCRDTSRASILTLVPPQTPVIRRGGGDSLIVEPGGLFYQWYVDGEAIPEANARVLRTHFDGEYSVRLIDSCGFEGRSETVAYEYVGRKGAGVSGGEVWLYPNPSRGAAWLRATGGPWQAARVTDLAGRLRFERDLRGEDLTRAVSLAPQGLEAGVYVVELRGNDAVRRLRWVVVE